MMEDLIDFGTYWIMGTSVLLIGWGTIFLLFGVLEYRIKKMTEEMEKGD